MLPLMIAIEKQDLEAVGILAGKGVDVNFYRPEMHCTYLVRSVQKGNNAITSCLIENGADVEFAPRGRKHLYPLLVALYREDLVSFQMLLDAGANSSNEYRVPGPRAGGTLLYSAIVHDLTDFASSILDRYPHQLNGNCGRQWALHPPITVAIVCQDCAMIDMLLERGADVNPNCSAKPLHVAARLGMQEVVSKLLLHGANVLSLVQTSNVEIFRTLNRSCMSAFSLAVSAGHLEIASLLLDHGARADGDKCMHNSHFLLSAEKASAELMNKLVQAGMFRNAFCFYHPTVALLDLALEKKLYKLSCHLISHGIIPAWRYKSVQQMKDMVSSMPDCVLEKLCKSGVLSCLSSVGDRLKDVLRRERFDRVQSAETLTEIAIQNVRYCLERKATAEPVWECIDSLEIPFLLKSMLKLE